MFGADEAGRGPVLGSLFIGLVDAPLDVLPEGLADSKDLSADAVTTIAESILNNSEIAVTTVEVTPPEIDAGESNVTQLTAEAMAEAIETTAESQKGVADACHPDAGVFADLVTQHLDDARSIVLEAEHEADTTVKQVMAASIVAKYEREQHVSALQEEYGDIGSGYPSDPKTRAFLETYVDEHGELPECARSSWGTAKEIVAASQQQTFSDYTPPA